MIGILSLAVGVLIGWWLRGARQPTRRQDADELFDPTLTGDEAFATCVQGWMTVHRIGCPHVDHAKPGVHEHVTLGEAAARARWVGCVALPCEECFPDSRSRDGWNAWVDAFPHEAASRTVPRSSAARLPK